MSTGRVSSGVAPTVAAAPMTGGTMSVETVRPTTHNHLPTPRPSTTHEPTPLATRTVTPWVSLKIYPINVTTLRDDTTATPPPLQYELADACEVGDITLAKHLLTEGQDYDIKYGYVNKHTGDLIYEEPLNIKVRVWGRVGEVVGEVRGDRRGGEVVVAERDASPTPTPTPYTLHPTP